MAALKQFRHCEVLVDVYESATAMAQSAALDAGVEIAELLAKHDAVNIIFAGAESQMEFHRALAVRPGIDWSRVNALAVDDFWCPGMPEECRVSAQPKRDLYSRVNPGSVNFIDPDAPDAEVERSRYEALLEKHPPHLACIGMGVSGHLALNEPGATDFNDSQKVRVVEVCAESKRQLEADPNFKAMDQIPAQGITCTIPALMGAAKLLVIVPYAIKAGAVRRFFQSDVSAGLPATILKTKPGTRLYLDAESFAECEDLEL
jgi:glucosamine-6-phosphate deaminase